MSDPEILPGNEKPGALTHSSLRDMVVGHIVENLSTFVPDGVSDKAGHLLKIVDLLDELCVNVAHTAIANRVNVSMADILGARIPSDPEEDASDTEHELRFRVIEQINSDASVSKNVYTYAAAVEKFGESFVEDYWGSMGENCPKCVTSKTTSGDEKKMWFSVIRVPAIDDGVKTAQVSQFKSPRL